MAYLNTLAETIREDGRARGWSPVTIMDWSTSDHKVPTFLALIHSEICEAYSETGSDSPDAFLASEFADVLIRTLDLAGGITYDFAHYVILANINGPKWTGTPSQVFCQLHQFVTDALEAFRNNDRIGLLTALGQLYRNTSEFAQYYYGYDVAKVIDDKMKLNRMRATKHGGKRV